MISAYTIQKRSSLLKNSENSRNFSYFRICGKIDRLIRFSAALIIGVLAVWRHNKNKNQKKQSFGNKWNLTSPLGGVDFEIVSFWFLVCHAATQLALQLHQERIQVVREWTRFNLWEGSFRFPLRARCCFRGSQAQPGKSEVKRSILWYHDRAGCAPLISWRRCRWAWRWRLLAIIYMHCFPKWASFGKISTKFTRGN